MCCAPSGTRMMCADVIKFRRTIERLLVLDPCRAERFVEEMGEALADPEEFRHMRPDPNLT